LLLFSRFLASEHCRYGLLILSMDSTIVPRNF
jgi:hypothetical protein